MSYPKVLASIYLVLAISLCELRLLLKQIRRG